MELKQLKCPICGAQIPANGIDFSLEIGRCPSCDTTFVISQAEKFARVKVDKSKDIVNCRANLSNAVGLDDVESILRYAQKIIDILPDDFEARYFFSYARARIGDARYLYEFYLATGKEYTEESCDVVVEHVIHHSDLRDNKRVENFLKSLLYSPARYLKDYKTSFEDRCRTEELYEDVPRDVFVCYKSENLRIAETVVEELEKDGNKCWISSRNLRPNDNDNYWDNITRAIKSCSIFLVVTSRDAMLSHDVKQEMAHAKELGKKRIELNIEPTAPRTEYFKDFFDGCKWIEGENYDEVRIRVADLLSKYFGRAKKAVSFASDKKISADKCANHKWKVVERKDPTCLDDGYVKYECIYCSATKQDVLPSTGHKMVLSYINEPTCIIEGNEIFRCAFCGYIEPKNMPKKEHTFGDWLLTKRPTCEEKGEEKRQCSFCGITQTREVPATGHGFGKWLVTNMPTCTNEGKEARQCNICGAIETRPIKTTGHRFRDWTLTKCPSCEKCGEETQICLLCGFVNTRTVPLKQHDYSEWQFDDEGKMQTRVCNRCGNIESRTTEEYQKVLEQSFKIDDKGKIIEYIGDDVDVIIPSTVTAIGNKAFANKMIDSITIPSSVKSIGNDLYNSLILHHIDVKYLGNIAEWCGIDGSNNIFACRRIFGATLYINGKKLEGDVVIPDGVTRIKCCAFKGFNLTSVTIPRSVTDIGWDAFDECKNLRTIYYQGDIANWCEIYGLDELMSTHAILFINGKKVEGNIVIPDGVTSLKHDVFCGCDSLTSITIGKDVKTIIDGAFSDCDNLKTIYYNGDVKGWFNIDGHNYLWDQNRTLYINNHEITDLVIPSNITRITRGDIAWFPNITSITIPASVKNIDQNAFSECDKLTSIHYAGDIAGWCAIAGLEYLMPADAEVYIGEKKPEGELIIPEGVESISSCAFKNCNGLTSVTIPNSVSKICWGAFSGCGNLTTITIGSGVEMIEVDAFGGCKNLKEISVDNNNSQYSSADGILYDKAKKAVLLVPNMKTGTVSIPNGLEYIKAGAFNGCTNLTSIIIPNTVKSIRDNAFKNCTSLKSITIPDSVKEIAESILAGCSALESISLPAVKQLERYNSGGWINGTYYYYICPFGCLFGEEEYLGGVKTKQTAYTDTVAKWEREKNNFIPASLKDVYVTSGEISQGYFENCNNLTSITISKNVTGIGDGAFSGISTIWFDGTMEQWNAIRKSDAWYWGMKYYTIHCKDGDIIKQKK